MDLQLITPTGDRPVAWKLCQEYIAQQTFGGKVIWHVTDDGRTGSPISFKRQGYELVYHRNGDIEHIGGENTQARNLSYMLRYIDPRIPLAVIEDDDWYSDNWLATIMNHIHNVSLVGEKNARYYNVQARKWRVLRNQNHSSLCSTAMIGDVITRFREICETRVKFIDLELWKLPCPKILLPPSHVVGLKNVGGRTGIGIGHRDDFIGSLDPEMKILREWIGHDVSHYM